MTDAVVQILKTEASEGASERLRGKVHEVLSFMAPLKFLIFTPAWKTAGQDSPASILAITENEWVLAEEKKDEVKVTHARLHEILRVEVTSILLCGRLEVVAATEGRRFSAVVLFNTVREHAYVTAVQLLLEGDAGPVTDLPLSSGHDATQVVRLSIRFRSAVHTFLPQNETLFDLVDWTSSRGRWLKREPSALGLLLRTGRMLVLISGEQPYLSVKADSGHGCVVSYFPLANLYGHTFGCGFVELHLGISGKLEERVKIEFPRERQEETASLLMSAECSSKESGKGREA